MLNNTDTDCSNNSRARSLNFISNEIQSRLSLRFKLLIVCYIRVVVMKVIKKYIDNRREYRVWRTERMGMRARRKFKQLLLRTFCALACVTFSNLVVCRLVRSKHLIKIVRTEFGFFPYDSCPQILSYYKNVPRCDHNIST